MTCIIAVVLLCQLRAGAGLRTYLPFGDVQAAFDTASRTEMLKGMFEAGVHGQHWMQFDDALRNDTCAISHESSLSEQFLLDDGTAQGRKISIAAFNCLMRKLHDILSRRSGGIGAYWRSTYPN